MMATALSRQADFGSIGVMVLLCVARCFSMSTDLDEEVALRLQSIAESFICPISCAAMEDPVATSDRKCVCGCRATVIGMPAFR